jgi:hypothetical protein
MSGAPWNTTDTERLRALASAGLSRSEIAIEMQRSKNAIRDWAEKLNIGIAKISSPATTANEAGNRKAPTGRDRAQGENMIRLRLAGAISFAAAFAGCFTYYVTPPQVEVEQGLVPTAPHAARSAAGQPTNR